MSIAHSKYKYNPPFNNFFLIIVATTITLLKPRPQKPKESLLSNSETKKDMRIEDYLRMTEKRNAQESSRKLNGMIVRNLMKISNACENRHRFESPKIKYMRVLCYFLEYEL